MKWFSVFMVGAVGVLAACNNGVIGTPGGQVGKITISPTTVQVGANQSKALTATVKDSAGNTLTNVQVNWEVMDTGVAKVVAKGKLAATLTGLEAGQTEVYATAGDVQSAPVAVVVSGNSPTPPPPPGPTPPPPPGPGPAKGLSGTLYAPTGGDVKGTFVLACVLNGQSCDGQDPRSKGLVVPSGGSSYSFSFDVEVTNYLVLAWKDINQSKEIDSGDYFVCYGGQSNDDCAVVSPPKQGLEMRMKVVGGNPGPGPGESSISGLLSAVAGSNLSGTYIFACDPTKDSCSSSAQYTGTAAQAPYTVKVASGKYYMVGWRDVNGNKKVDAGDHFGCHGENAQGQCAVFEVNGAVTGKDIKLGVMQGGGEVQPLNQGMLKTLNLNASVNYGQVERFFNK